MDTQHLDGIVTLLNNLTHTVQEISVRLGTLETKVSTRTRDDTCQTCQTSNLTNKKTDMLDMHDNLDMYNKNININNTCDMFDNMCDRYTIALERKNQLTLHADECNQKHLEIFLSRCQFESGDKFADFFDQLNYYRPEHIRQAMHVTLKKITDADPRGYFFAVARRLRTESKQQAQTNQPQAWQPNPPPTNKGKLKTFREFAADRPEQADKLKKLMGETEPEPKPVDNKQAWNRAIKMVNDHEQKEQDDDQKTIDKAQESAVGLEDLPF